MAQSGDEDFGDAFIRANANQDFIAAQVEDLLRMLMRGVGSQDPSAVAYKAAVQLNFIIKLVKQSQSLDTIEVLKLAMQGVAEGSPYGDVEEAQLRLAKAGLMYLVEATASDNAARARASKRWDQVESSQKWLEASKEERRKRWREGL